LKCHFIAVNLIGYMKGDTRERSGAIQLAETRVGMGDSNACTSLVLFPTPALSLITIEFSNHDAARLSSSEAADPVLPSLCR